MKGKLLLLSLWFTCQIATAQSVKTVNITFDQQDFAISNNEMGDIVFDSSKHILTYNEDDKEPGLPLIPYNVVIPEGSPNPTNGEVTISTQLDNNVNNAIIVISSITGNREKTLTIPQGTYIITENIADLNAGIHIISLIVNGILTDSQRIIKE
ncbi:MAG: T9SS type A sorting domain-containing protein [Clostridium sp.]|nr:T9SS type A sorting domain-containing protein [Clostridium sp.]